MPLENEGMELVSSPEGLFAIWGDRECDATSNMEGIKLGKCRIENLKGFKRSMEKPREKC